MKITKTRIIALLIALMLSLLSACSNNNSNNSGDTTTTPDNNKGDIEIVEKPFENGHLYDVGQKYGFGPGQTDWITRMPGTMHDESLVT